MKTNQVMKIKLGDSTVDVEHKTGLCDLTQLWTAGNGYRISEGKSIANLTKFLGSSKTKEFIEVCKSRGEPEPLKVIGKGNRKKTLANLHLMIYAAEYISVEFHYEVIDTFIKGKILEYRDDSGDMFKTLNNSIDEYMPKREGKKGNLGLYINCAKIMKARIKPDGDGWNTATADQLKKRLYIESAVASALKMKLIKSKEDLFRCVSEA